MIVLDESDGLWNWVRRVLGWGSEQREFGPPATNTADTERVVRAVSETTERAERAERLVKDFTDKQRREVEALRERVRFYERRGGG